MTVDQALKVAAAMYPRGVLRCEDGELCRIVHNGREVAAGRDWPEAFRAARAQRAQRKPLEQQSLL